MYANCYVKHCLNNPDPSLNVERILKCKTFRWRLFTLLQSFKLYFDSTDLYANGCKKHYLKDLKEATKKGLHCKVVILFDINCYFFLAQHKTTACATSVSKHQLKAAGIQRKDDDPSLCILSKFPPGSPSLSQHPSCSLLYGLNMAQIVH